jgi:pimeloyl-ACP methyl ester carboxylesterase
VIASSRVTAEGETPSKWLLFLHGILGTGGNWRSLAQKLVKARPTWGAVLADLRNHGGSREGFSPPHSIEACAKDLAGIECDAVLGHSFGGKVALEFVRQRAGDLDAVFIVDSTPAPRLDLLGTDWGSLGVVKTLRALPKTMPRRNDFTQALVDRGIDLPTAQWLAMNVRRREDGLFDLPLDLDAIREMLDDYFTVDLWDVVERAPGRVNITFVAGAQGSVPEEDRVRAHAEIVENAGHWVHVDAPDRLLEIVRSRLE